MRKEFKIERAFLMALSLGLSGCVLLPALVNKPLSQSVKAILPNETGTLSIKINWPVRKLSGFEAQAIPVETNTIVVRVLQGNVLIAEKSIGRTPGIASVTENFSLKAANNLNVEVSAYAEALPLPSAARPLARGSGVANIVPSKDSRVSITLDALQNVPSISNLNQNVAKSGQLITITGSNFGADGDPVEVWFNGVKATSLVRSGNNQLMATVPDGTRTGLVMVRVNGIDSSSSYVLWVLQSLSISVPRMSVEAGGLLQFDNDVQWALDPGKTAASFGNPPLPKWQVTPAGAGTITQSGLFTAGSVATNAAINACFALNDELKSNELNLSITAPIQTPGPTVAPTATPTPAPTSTPTPTQAPPIGFDQQQLDQAISYPIGAMNKRLQSFIATKNGELTKVEVVLKRGNAFQTGVDLKLYRADALGSPVGAQLASVAIPYASIPTFKSWVSASFGTPVPVAAQEHYVIMLSSDNAPNDNAQVFASNSDTYSNGEGLFGNAANGPWFANVPASDLAFRTTLIVPEPNATTPPNQPVITGSIDQQQTDFPLTYGIDPSFRKGQVFAAGRAGRITAVSLVFGRAILSNANVPLDLYRVGSDGLPTGIPIASAFIPGGTITTTPNWVTAVFDNPFTAAVNQKYAWVISGSTGMMGASDDDRYPLGTAVDSYNNAAWSEMSTDFAFRVYSAP
ncbi:MAG TPA: hypothetical protein DD435_07015 [Cyanobacteria bacterium UBA8530]|nr:hypothetical protein [Cyanobacteria bacterium UBA8530]